MIELSVEPSWRHLTRWLMTAIDRSVAFIAATDRDALVAELFAAEGARLVRMARLFTDDRNAAEDLVQEAFIRLHRAAHRINDPAKALPYLRSIVINRARDHNRRGLMSLRHQEALPAGSAPDAPEDALLLDEQRLRVVEELRQLSPRQRDCILLRFYLELTEVETAEVLGISNNSVKTHCRRGMEALRQRMGDPE